MVYFNLKDVGEADNNSSEEVTCVACARRGVRGTWLQGGAQRHNALLYCFHGPY